MFVYMFILILNVWKKLMLATVLDNHAGKLSSQAYIANETIKLYYSAEGIILVV